MGKSGESRLGVSPSSGHPLEVQTEIHLPGLHRTHHPLSLLSCYSALVSTCERHQTPFPGLCLHHTWPSPVRSVYPQNCSRIHLFSPFPPAHHPSLGSRVSPRQLQWPLTGLPLPLPPCQPSSPSSLCALLKMQIGSWLFPVETLQWFLGKACHSFLVLFPPLTFSFFQSNLIPSFSHMNADTFSNTSPLLRSLP